MMACRLNFEPVLHPDKVAFEWRKAVERDCGSAGAVGAGRQEVDHVTDLQSERQMVGMAAVENIGAVAGRAGEDYRAAVPTVARRADAIMDPLRKRLVEPVVDAGVEVDPALALARRFARNQQNLGAQQAS